MLQTVLGLDAARLASAFLVAPATMGQRLVRAKARITRAGLPYAVPEPAELPERLGCVLDAIYAAYGIAWDALPGGAERWLDLAGEAIWLARVTVSLLPDAPEARGLVALLLFSHARRLARRDAHGAYIPLVDQDVTRWDGALIDEAESHLRLAAAAARPGAYQLEAAIQSAHASRRVTGHTPWAGIAVLYDGLVSISPTVGVLVGRAAAIGEAAGPTAGLHALEALPASRITTYQPYWALRATLLARAGEAAAAREAYQRAAGLTDDPAVRAFLLAGGRRAPAAGRCQTSSGGPDVPPRRHRSGIIRQSAEAHRHGAQTTGRVGADGASTGPGDRHVRRGHRLLPSLGQHRRRGRDPAGRHLPRARGQLVRQRRRLLRRPGRGNSR